MHHQGIGAAGEATGSCHLVHVGDRTILLDCGLVQGGRSADKRNREPFPFDASTIDAAVLGHAPIDRKEFATTAEVMQPGERPNLDGSARVRVSR